MSPTRLNIWLGIMVIILSVALTVTAVGKIRCELNPPDNEEIVRLKQEIETLKQARDEAEREALIQAESALMFQIQNVQVECALKFCIFVSGGDQYADNVIDENTYMDLQPLYGTYSGIRWQLQTAPGDFIEIGAENDILFAIVHHINLSEFTFSQEIVILADRNVIPPQDTAKK